MVTGHLGYIGCVLAPMLAARGHEVVGVDSNLFEGCDLGPEPEPRLPLLDLRRDVRELGADDLRGLDAIVHLAGISNDPLGDLRPECTYDVNHRATVRLARLARRAGVARFLQSSSCSLYGAGGDAVLDESAPWNPVTAYGRSKLLVERDLAPLASAEFSPVFLRNATVYGVSPRLRGDLVVNNLVGHAVTTGEVLLKSDGTPWRPLVHVEDVARAFVLALEAPRPLVHDQAFNVGASAENHRIREVAEIVGEVVPESRLAFGEGAGPDLRNYRVDCERIRRVLGFRTQWTVRRGAEELRDAYKREGLTRETFLSSRFLRIARVRALQESGALDESLRWTVPDRRGRES